MACVKMQYAATLLPRLLVELACFVCFSSQSIFKGLLGTWLVSTCTFLLCLLAQSKRGAAPAKGLWCAAEALLLPTMAVALSALPLHLKPVSMLPAMLMRRGCWASWKGWPRPFVLYTLMRMHQVGACI